MAILSEQAIAGAAPPGGGGEDRGADLQKSLLFLSGANMSASVEHRVAFKNGESVSLACPEWRRWKVVLADAGYAAIGRLTTCLHTAAGLAIWYHGGPFAAVNEDLPPEQVAMLAAGYDLFEPFYPLSADRDLLYDGSTVAPTLVDAEHEAEAAIGWGERRYARLAVVGESLGAIYASVAARHLREPMRGDQIILINPFLDGAEELVDGFRGSETDIKAKSGLSFEAFRDIVRKSLNGWQPLSDDAIGALSRDARIRLIYSPADRRVNGPALDLVARALPGSCRVERRPQNGHEAAATRAQYNRFLQLLSC